MGVYLNIILVVVEPQGSQIISTELKSESEITGSVEAGVLRPKDPKLQADFRELYKIGAHHEVEEKVLQRARKEKGKIIMEGKNVTTGEI